MVRVYSGSNSLPIVVRKNVASKGGGGSRARRGSSGSEDEDYGVRKGKDDRVYDRFVPFSVYGLICYNLFM